MYNLEKDEIILYEGNITIEGIKKSVKFTLTNKNMLFAKERGIFNKKLKIYKVIPISNIKTYKGNVQVKQKKNNITIETLDKMIDFTCPSAIEGQKIVNDILYAKTGKNIIERSNSKIKNTLKKINDSKEIILTIAGIVIPLLHRRKK